MVSKAGRRRVIGIIITNTLRIIWSHAKRGYSEYADLRRLLKPFFNECIIYSTKQTLFISDAFI